MIIEVKSFGQLYIMVIVVLQIFNTLVRTTIRDSQITRELDSEPFSEIFFFIYTYCNESMLFGKRAV